MFKRIKFFYYAAIIIALCVPHAATFAKELASLTWSDRVSRETTDGDIIDTSPFVEIGTIRLSRFSQMQSLTLQETIQIGDGDDTETLYIFRAWQGGAGQGEQLMLVTASAKGLDVIGPYEQNFEKLFVLPAVDDFGLIFELYGTDKNEPLKKIEYLDGQLINLKIGVN